MEAGRYDEACPKFEESLRLDHGMGTQFNLAHCWEKLGRTASAWALFLDVAAAARAGNQPDRERAARERANAIEPKLTRLKITITAPIPEMKVMRGQQEVGRAAWGTAVPVDPGDHVIRVSAPGKREWSQEVNVPADSKAVSITVPELEDAPESAQEQLRAPTEAVVTEEGPSPASPASGDSSGQKTAAYVIGGAGIAAAAVGTIFMLQSRSDNAEAKKLCTGGDGTICEGGLPEQDRYYALRDDAKREQLIGIIGLGVGGAALVTATVLFFNADSGPETPESAFSVTPVLGLGNWGASVSASF